MMGIVAERIGVDLSKAVANVEKFMVADPTRRIGELKVHIVVPNKVSEKDQIKLEHVALTCPVHQSLHPDIKLPITFEWGG